MIYVISDLHGAYEKYAAMLEKIHFSPEDTLYVLGDVLDRGREPFRILRDMESRSNVIPLMGNHEMMAEELLWLLTEEVTLSSLEDFLSEGEMMKLLLWMRNGAAGTIAEFSTLSREERERMLAYLDTFELYAEVEAGGRKFILVHAGLKNFDPARPLEDYHPAELLQGRRDWRQRYYDDPSIFVVCGHTPTQLLTGRPEVIMESGNILIDCGAVFEGGRLACLCLDNLEVYYVE